MSKVKPIFVPLSERPHIINDAELMGYTGMPTWDSLNLKFFKKGLVPDSIMGQTKYYYKSTVDRFIKTHSDQKTDKLSKTANY